MGITSVLVVVYSACKGFRILYLSQSTSTRPLIWFLCRIKATQFRALLSSYVLEAEPT